MEDILRIIRQKTPKDDEYIEKLKKLLERMIYRYNKADILEPVEDTIWLATIYELTDFIVKFELSH